MTGEHDNDDIQNPDEGFILDEREDEDLDEAFASVEREVGAPVGAPSDQDEHAELDFDDEDLFVLDDDDESADAFLAGVDDEPTADPDMFEAAFLAAESGELAEPGLEFDVPPGSATPEDVLFADLQTPTAKQPGSPHEAFEPHAASFSEDAGSSWEGDAVDPEELGIGVNGPHRVDHSIGEHAADAEELADDAWDEELEVENVDDANPFEQPELGVESPAGGGAAFGVDDDGAPDPFIAGTAAAGWEQDPSWVDEPAAAEAEWPAEQGAEGEGEADWQDEGEDEWADRPEDEVDPIYGSEALEAAAAEAAGTTADAYEEPDYSEYEESYVDAGPHAVAEGATLRPRRRVWTTLAAAAAVIIGVGGGVLWMRPDWLGLGARTSLIDRAVIARPQLDLTLPVPTATPPDVLIAQSPDDPPVVTPVVDPATDPLVNTDPVPTPSTDPIPTTDPVAVTDPLTDPPGGQNTDPLVPTPVDPPVATGDPPIRPVTDPIPPVAVDPRPETDPNPLPVDTDPVEPLVAIPLGPDATPTPKADPDAVKVGDDLTVSRHETPAEIAVHHLAEGLVSGSQAFAQLKNMNVFMGKVKAMDAAHITLRVEGGEVTLAFDEVHVLIPLGSEEFRSMQDSAQGYVRLRNRNKLFGKLLDSNVTDNVVLEIQKHRVTVPREAIEEIVHQPESTVRILDEEGGDWVRRLLEQRANQQRNATPPDSGR